MKDLDHLFFHHIRSQPSILSRIISQSQTQPTFPNCQTPPPLNPLHHCIETARRSARRGGAVGGGGAGTLGRHQAKPVVHAAEDEDGGDDGVGWSRSLTDDDIEELKGCADLGFKFSYDEIPEFCYSMSQRLLDDHPSPAAAPEAVAPVAPPITPTGRSPAPEDGAIAAAAGSGAFVLDAQQVFEARRILK